jgi:hypothetical protein
MCDLSEQQTQQLVAASECMRNHGVTGFPDPTTAPPTNLNPLDYGIAEDIGGFFLLVPSTFDVHSPAFEHAAKACDLH